MNICTADLIGMAPIMFGAPVLDKKEKGESDDAFERRSWKKKMHIDQKGRVFIPPTAIKRAMTDVASYMSETVPGKGKKTYTKFFISGIMVVEPMILCRQTADEGVGNAYVENDAEDLPLFVPSDGRSGGGKRVWRHFPVFQAWSTQVAIHVMEPMLIETNPDRPQCKVEEYLVKAGYVIGMGTSRPQNNYYFGRWNVKNFAVTKS